MIIPSDIIFSIISSINKKSLIKRQFPKIQFLDTNQNHITTYTAIANITKIV